MRRNKKAQQISTLFFTMVAFALVITFSVSLLQGINSPDYPISKNNETKNTLKLFNRTADLTDNLTDEMSFFSTNIQNRNQTRFDEGSGGVIGGLLRNAWNTLLLVFKLPTIALEGVALIASVLGLPAWVYTFASLVIFATIIFAILTIVFKARA
jgi:hypothetical protein